MNKVWLLILLLTSQLVWSQSPSKKRMTHDDLVNWTSIEDRVISNDGKWIAYTLNTEEGDPELVLWNGNSLKSITFNRADNPQFSEDNLILSFTKHPAQDSVKELKRKKVKKEDLPKDSLVIYHLSSGQTEYIPDVKKYTLGEKWSGWLVCHLEPEISKKDSTEKDTTTVESDTIKVEKNDKKVKKENKDNGSKLLIKSYLTEYDTTIPYVKSFTVAEEAPVFMLHTTGVDSTFEAGVLLFEGINREIKRLDRGKGEYTGMTTDKWGQQAAWIINRDTTKTYIPPNELRYWTAEKDSTISLLEYGSDRLPQNWIVSQHKTPVFSDDGSFLYFGIAPPPIVLDTSLLEEEIVNVEVWHWDDPVLYTQQNKRAEQERKRSYDVVIIPATGQMIQIADMELPETTFDKDRNSGLVLKYNDRPYLKTSSWEGFPPARDLYNLDVNKGQEKLIGNAIRGGASFSSDNNFVYWYSKPDSVWVVYDIQEEVIRNVTNNREVAFYDELHDSPDFPYAYGLMGWSESDQWMFIYDRYDIWKIDPTSKKAPVRITNGRQEKTVYRYIQLDKEEKFINDTAQILLHLFNETDKSSGYSELNLATLELQHLTSDQMYFTPNVRKARDRDVVLFTKESFQTFPDLLVSDLSFKHVVKISNANPRQKDYAWGSVELYEWTSLDGETLQGLLYKPGGFDAKKKYPMIVNFYERSSDGLYRHRAPSAGRSTINYSFYVNRGYVIFSPDIPYREGYPGESAYNAVVPGVTSLIGEGFIDKDRIGVQGHSWGGYQIAYLLTRTNIFKCAESGAPVVNMISAYGGIRWETGLSRMFQYEKTQSRIGGSIWEYPLRYIENSPIFTMDKVQTPVLIMHNDKDGHVPWYQGIEYFIALRRLGKPAWLLNYNEEPHWPLKLQNRKDFNIRMQQFFDHYLMNEPMPTWMKQGVPAIEKSIHHGYEYTTD